MSASKMSLNSDSEATPQTERYICPRLDCSFEGTFRNSVRTHDRVHKKQLPLLTPIQCDFPGCSYRTSKDKHLQAHVLNRHNPNRPSFKCHLCEKSLSTKYALLQHTQRHTGEMLPCTVCDFMTSNPYALRLHIRRHELGNKGIEWLKRPNTHKCQICGYAAPSEARVLMHARVHSAERIFKCSVPGCEHRTKWKGNLQQHEDRHDPLKSTRFKCPMCPKRFCTEYQVTRHVRTHTQERPRECPDCDYKAATLVQVKRHQKRHHFNGARYSSPEVKKEVMENQGNELNLVAETKYSLREGLRPIKIKAGPSHHYKAATLVQVKRHQKRHHSNGTRYSSPEVKKDAMEDQGNELNAVAETKYSLREGLRPIKASGYYKSLQDMHSKVDNSQEPKETIQKMVISKPQQSELDPVKIKEETGSSNICSTCGFKPKRLYNLAKHMKVHSEDKPLKCGFTHCKFATKWDRSIIEHVKRVHTPKYYACPYEGCSFSSMDPVLSRKHRSLHKLPFKRTINCPICPKKYASIPGIQFHLLTHTGEKAYQCNLCVYAATSRTHLKLHVSRVHFKQQK